MNFSNSVKRYTDGTEPNIVTMIQAMVKRGLQADNKKNNGKKKGFTLHMPNVLGRLSLKELEYLSTGVEYFSGATKVGFDNAINSMMTGKDKVDSKSIYLLNSRDFIISALDYLSFILQFETDTLEYKQRLEKLEILCELASEGMIIEKEKDKNGEMREIIVSPRQVEDAYEDYYEYKQQLCDKAMTFTLGLGVSCYEILGALLNKDTTKKEKKSKFNIVAFATVATAAIRIIQDISFDDIHKEERKLQKEQFNLIFDFLYNQKISQADADDQKDAINTISNERKEIIYSYKNKVYSLEMMLNVLKGISSGIYLSTHIKSKQDFSQALSKALVELMASKSQASNVIDAARMVPELRKLIGKFHDVKDRVDLCNAIYHQHNQLVGATSDFNSFKIKGFVGYFHPREDKETGNTTYQAILDIYEFEAKKGDMILIIGDSGSGKSLFLRLLKNEDFNKDNQQQIELDNGQKVDYLGNQYIYLNPEYSFTDEDSILLQMTGKKAVKDLTEDEKNRLLSVLDSLELKQQIYDKVCKAKNINTNSQIVDDSQIGESVLDYLSKAINQEFSLGQERRLALTKVFYRELDPASVLLFDEPASNVEDELALKEFKLMAEYAKKRNMILIFTTHNKAAQQIATKCYHMNNGILRLVNDKMRPSTETIPEDFSL